MHGAMFMLHTLQYTSSVGKINFAVGPTLCAPMAAVLLLQHVIQLAHAKGIKTVNVIRQRSVCRDSVIACSWCVLQLACLLVASKCVG
jgi:hypothetical protein